MGGLHPFGLPRKRPRGVPPGLRPAVLRILRAVVYT